MGRHLTVVADGAGVREAYRVRPIGDVDEGHAGLLVRRFAGGPWLLSYGPPSGGSAFTRDVALPAVLDAAAAGAIAGEVLTAYNADRCPDPAAHAPQCAETRYDDRGDCDGQVGAYVAATFVQGRRPGEALLMCANHGRQAARHREVRP